MTKHKTGLFMDKLGICRLFSITSKHFVNACLNTIFKKIILKYFLTVKKLDQKTDTTYFFLPLSLLAEGHNSHVFKLYQCQGVY